jgi:GGDEF domain-containing protein
MREAAVRQGIGCVLCEAGPGSLGEVRRCLEAWRFVCRSMGAEEAAEAATGGDLLVVEVCSESSASVAAAVAAQRAAGGGTLALCGSDDARAVSRAASLGCDDMLVMPFDPIGLIRRLQTLSSLAALNAERRRRGEIFAPYGGGAPVTPLADPSVGHLPSVALLGRSDMGQVQVSAALPPASLTYLENAARLPAALRNGGVDLLVVTQPGLLEPALTAVETTAGEPPFLVAAHAGAPWALELPPQIDLLSLPAPVPLARVRLALALRITALRRWLREPPLGTARDLLIDSLTGLYNQGAFLDYLRTAGEDRALIGLEHDRLDWVNQQSGYAAGNRVLAQLGRSLRRRVRAHDLPAHLGGGRFAVAVPAENGAKLGRLQRRLQTTVAEDEPWLMLAAAEDLPIRGTPVQRLARLFGDLRRLRPAA